MRARPKTILFAVMTAGLLLVVIRGAWVAGYSPVTSDNYLWGAFHVHSTLSDGLAPLDDISTQARDARVGVVLLSDHGPPHRDASVLDETIGGVRFIGGSEVGMPEGHLIVSDVDRVPDYNLPPFPPDAVSDVAAWGGFSVLTYPEDPTHRWRYWENDFLPDAIEIINVTSYFRASSTWDKLEWATFSLFNRFYYVSAFESPAYALERWDELLTRGRVWGFYAANAHGGFPLTEETMIGIPSYETAFSYVGFGIDPGFAADPMRAIREGHFFSIVRGAGEPNRFEFVRHDGDQLRVRLDVEGLSPRIELLHDGVAAARTHETELAHAATGPGVYRVEVYLDDHPLLDPDVPWILSNPIWIGTPPATPHASEPTCDAIDAVTLSELRVEKDDASNATIELDADGALALDYELSRATADDVNRWVALALRRPIELGEYRGVFVAGTAPEPMRYWVELRSGNVGYYATFKLDAEPSGNVIPWNRFYATLGESREFPLTSVDAMFITVNTSSSRTGFSSRFELTELGWCR